MLQKNVYILYPPGYCGSYINWAINASDQDLESTTVKNPVNNSNSKEFGGAGTSHLHVRIPTHQGIDHHLSWVLLNQPTDKRVYIISTDSREILFAIKVISQYDPDGVFISVHNNNSPAVDAYGNINCVTKWPTYVEIMTARIYPMHDTFDAYNCSQDREFRNYVVHNHRHFFRHNSIIDQKALRQNLYLQEKWFEIRHRAQPHEVNESMYLTNVDLTNRLFEISCQDICSDAFLPWFKQFMTQANVSTAYSLDTVTQAHDSYVAAQRNLQWFKSFAHWQATGELDSYLTSHSIIEAYVILEILKSSNVVKLNLDQRDQWVSFYTRCRGPDWPDTDSEYDFFDLPDWVKKEIVDFGYQFNLTAKPNPAILALDWENMSIQDINDVYQKHK